DRLFALGEHSTEAVRTFGSGARHYPDCMTLIADLEARLDAAPVPPRILIKGSRGMRMERVTRALAPENASC
ncbi:MAG: hypothetical protein R3202_13615, partial [Candidatus Competibacterales bacterium]|nr:hypothetical protein [Candidatus Competibacterales bacterium]